MSDDLSIENIIKVQNLLNKNVGNERVITCLLDGKLVTVKIDKFHNVKILNCVEVEQCPNQQ